jgi:hypothetical protein
MKYIKKEFVKYPLAGGVVLQYDSGPFHNSLIGKIGWTYKGCINPTIIIAIAEQILSLLLRRLITMRTEESWPCVTEVDFLGH